MKTTRYFMALITALMLYCQSYAQDAQAIAAAATGFLKTLSPEEIKTTQLAFKDSSRYAWTNLPVGLVPRSGIRYGSLSDKSRTALHEVLSTVLSSQGYLKVTGIMQLDDILNSLFELSYQKGEMTREAVDNILKNMKWGHDNYYISIWGTPEGDQPWGFNMGGHHLALSLTIKGKIVSFTPLFIGTDPAQVDQGKYAGWRVLSKEEDYGFQLLNFLSKEQKAKAILSLDIPKDIITNPKSSQRITKYSGISAREFNVDQMEVFKILIQEYLHNFEHNIAHRLYEKITKSGFDNVYFAWIGGTERHKPHYYVINGPDFLIEYDNVGFKNDGNHIHAILREKENDFGADLLREHYLNSEHHKK